MNSRDADRVEMGKWLDDSKRRRHQEEHKSHFRSEENILKELIGCDAQIRASDGFVFTNYDFLEIVRDDPKASNVLYNAILFARSKDGLGSGSRFVTDEERDEEISDLILGSPRDVGIGPLLGDYLDYLNNGQ